MASPNLPAVTTVTPAVLATGGLSTMNSTLYTVPAGRAVKNLRASAINASGGTTATVTFYTNAGMIAQRNVGAALSIVVDELVGLSLPDPETIPSLANGAAGVKFHFSGLVFS